jgi:tetratricopeptide (TPR) repeat protein
MMVVGLAGFAGQAAMLTECYAWDSVPAAFIEDVDNSEPMPAQAQQRRYVDESVQQAGYYDSRPRPSAAAAGIQQSSGNRGGALFRGQKVKMPSLPFGRATATNRAMARVPQSSGPATAPNNGGQLPNQSTADLAARQRSIMQKSQAGMQQSQAGRPMAASSNPQVPRANSGRPPQPIAQDSMPQQRSQRPAPAPRVQQAAAAKPPIPNTSSVSPWNPNPRPVRTPTTALPAAQPQPAQPPQPVQQAHTQPAIQRVQQSAPASPADRLVTEAHTLSTRAQYEEDYTQVIETCRRAQASQASPATSLFAKNLIAWSLNRRGQLRAESGREKEAILDFDEAIRNDATCWRALHNRGVLLAQAGQFETAFDDFSRTIQLNPQFAKGHSNRAALYLVADNLDAALADYRRAIELDADLAVAHRGCGRVCQLTGRVEEAIAHYDASVQLAPNDGYAAACRADLLTDIGRYAEAEAEYERAIEIDPSLSQAHGGSAWLLATCPDDAIRNAELAIERAKTAIERGGDQDALNYDTLAAAQASAGDFQAAIDAAQRAVELAPADERETYRDRLTLYQQAKPYRIAPIERTVQQVGYEEQTR